MQINNYKYVIIIILISTHIYTHTYTNMSVYIKNIILHRQSIAGYDFRNDQSIWIYV